jgi:hypothetical protein
VAGTTSSYNTGAAAGNLVFGASLNESSNFFQGQLDNFSEYVAGDNTAAGGKNYGTVDLTTDNDFIRQALVGKPAGDVDLNGSVGQSDVTAFVANWLKSKKVGGVTVGDITTRTMGDFNFDGVVNIDDAYILHHALSGGGQAALAATLLSELGGTVPEPSSIVLALCSAAGAVIVARCRRYRS